MSLPEFPAEQPRYPEASQATTALVLGIIGLVVNILAPFAWWIRQRELDGIASGRRSPDNRGTATTAKVVGIIGTIFLAASVLFIFVLFYGVFPLFGFGA